VRLLQTDHPTLLVTWGTIRPTIVVPAAAADWPADRIRVVLSHEYAHIQRHDWLVQMAASLLRAAHWFNPLMWVVVARLRQESERACDDAVLRQGVDASDYAVHLLDIARGFTRQRNAWVPAPAIARPSSLERRVSAMLDGRLNRRPLTRTACIVAGLALLAATVPIAGFGEPQAPSVLSGVLRDPSGAPVANATIYLTRVLANPGSLHPAVVYQLQFDTDATGRFEFSGLPPGEYRIASSAPGAVPVMGLRLNAGEQVERDLQLKFGPFRELWTVVPSVLEAAPTRRPLPDGWRCAERGGPLCGPASLVDEFERDEQVRQASPFGNPRRQRMDSVEDFQPFRGVSVEGVVEIEGRLGTDGVFTSARVVSAAHPELERAALETVARMKWDPARARGAAVDVPMTVTIEVLREPRGLRRQP
jgi:TonB family protein